MVTPLLVVALLVLLLWLPEVGAPLVLLAIALGLATAAFALGEALLRRRHEREAPGKVDRAAGPSAS